MLIGNCIDMDDGKTNKMGKGCSDYRFNGHACEYFDTADFKAKKLCCYCGGGSGMNIFIEFN